MKYKKELLALLVVAILIATYFVFTRIVLEKNRETPVTSDTPAKNADQKVVNTLAQVAVDATALPKDLPIDLPLEKGYVLTQNSVTDVGEGKVQSVIAFNSKATMKENYDRYGAYLKEKGWYITNTAQNKTVSSFYALYRNKEMNITISSPVPNAGIGKSLVTISVLQTNTAN